MKKAHLWDRWAILFCIIPQFCSFWGRYLLQNPNNGEPTFSQKQIYFIFIKKIKIFKKILGFLPEKANCIQHFGNFHMFVG